MEKRRLHANLHRHQPLLSAIQVIFASASFFEIRHFLQSYEIADFQNCNRQDTVFYQANVYHRKVILLHIMALLYKLGSLRRLSSAKYASLRYILNLK